MVAESEVIDRAEIERRAAARGAPMSMQNGNGASEAELRAVIDRVDRETAEGERDEMKRHQQELERRLSVIADKLEEMTANTRPRLVRSTMSAAEKSRIIRERGLAAYQAIPWS
jgi:hypothetical protein